MQSDSSGRFGKDPGLINFLECQEVKVACAGDRCVLVDMPLP